MDVQDKKEIALKFKFVLSFGILSNRDHKNICLINLFDTPHFAKAR